MERLRREWGEEDIWPWVEKIHKAILSWEDPSLILIDAWKGPFTTGRLGRTRKKVAMKTIRGAKPVLRVINTQAGQEWLKHLGHRVLDWLLTL